MLTAKHTLVAMVTDKPGVLNRAASFSKARFQYRQHNGRAQ